MVFFDIFSEFSVYGLTSPQPSEILVPTLQLSRVYFISTQVLLHSPQHNPFLYHLHYFGPVASGKTSLSKIISSTYSDMQIFKNIDNTLNVHKVHKAISKKTGFKGDKETKLIVVIEDVHMDKENNIMESIRN